MATPQQNFEAGRSALRVFYSETVKVFPNSSVAKMGFDAFIQNARNLTPPDFKQDDIERLGDAILWSQYPLVKVNKVMKELALAYSGRMPDKKGFSLMLKALHEDSISISYQTELLAKGAAEGLSKAKNAFVFGGLSYALILGGIAVFAFAKSAKG